MVTTQQTSTVDSQKIKKKESKHLVTENHQFIKEGSKKGIKEQGYYKTARTQ